MEQNRDWVGGGCRRSCRWLCLRDFGWAWKAKELSQDTNTFCDMRKTRLQLLFLLHFLSFRWRKVLLVRLTSNLSVVPDFGKRRRAHSSTKLSSFFALSLFLCESVYMCVCVYVCLYLVSVSTLVPSKDSNSYAVCLLVIVFVAVFVALLTRRP